jgi:cytochrome c553
MPWAVRGRLSRLFRYATTCRQQSTYIENQLRAFIERRRPNPVMFTVARVLSPAMISALAEHFRDLNSRPIGGAPKERIASGKAIYEEGLPESNIPACAACHGPDAKGQGEIPRLAGQLFPYTVKVLTNWSKERGQGRNGFVGADRAQSLPIGGRRHRGLMPATGAPAQQPERPSGLTGGLAAPGAVASMGGHGATAFQIRLPG